MQETLHLQVSEIKNLLIKKKPNNKINSKDEKHIYFWRIIEYKYYYNQTVVLI